MNLAAAAPGAPGILERVAAVDWIDAATRLDARGWSVLQGLLRSDECAGVARLYEEDRRFRSRIDMSRHAFGSGEYKYFAYPLPDVVEQLRAALYPRLAPIADRWNENLRVAERYPATLAEFLARCHSAGQTKPTPLLLRYGPGDYNRLHQDLYGERVFPIQVAILLSRPEEDFAGGEFVLTEQRPRMQSRAMVVPLSRGDGVAFAVHDRPARGPRGFSRARMRHGVSEVRSGERYTLGVIFHEAK